MVDIDSSEFDFLQNIEKIMNVDVIMDVIDLQKLLIYGNYQKNNKSKFIQNHQMQEENYDMEIGFESRNRYQKHIESLNQYLRILCYISAKTVNVRTMYQILKKLSEITQLFRIIIGHPILCSYIEFIFENLIPHTSILKFGYVHQMEYKICPTLLIQHIINQIPEDEYRYIFTTNQIYLLQTPLSRQQQQQNLIRHFKLIRNIITVLGFPYNVWNHQSHRSLCSTVENQTINTSFDSLQQYIPFVSITQLFYNQLNVRIEKELLLYMYILKNVIYAIFNCDEIRSHHYNKIFYIQLNSKDSIHPISNWNQFMFIYKNSFITHQNCGRLQSHQKMIDYLKTTIDEEHRQISKTVHNTGKQLQLMLKKKDEIIDKTFTLHECNNYISQINKYVHMDPSGQNIFDNIINQFISKKYTILQKTMFKTGISYEGTIDVNDTFIQEPDKFNKFAELILYQRVKYIQNFVKYKVNFYKLMFKHMI